MRSAQITRSLSPILLLLLLAGGALGSRAAIAAEFVDIASDGNIAPGYACDVLDFFAENLGECNAKATERGYPYFARTLHPYRMTCWGCFAVANSAPKATSPQPAPASKRNAELAKVVEARSAPAADVF